VKIALGSAAGTSGAGELGSRQACDAGSSHSGQHAPAAGQQQRATAARTHVCICLHVCTTPLSLGCVQFPKYFTQNITSNLAAYIYRVLNVDEIKKLIAQFTIKSRDESFKPN
jgi:hypothetical protein